jgi:hypothetical protein
VVFVGSAVLLIFHAWTGSLISRREGAFMLTGYLLYLAYLLARAAGGV